jgi:hypothetical protein
MKVIKYIILYLVPVPEPYLITVPIPIFKRVPVPIPQGKKLRFLRFRFHNTGVATNNHKIPQVSSFYCILNLSRWEWDWAHLCCWWGWCSSSWPTWTPCPRSRFPCQTCSPSPGLRGAQSANPANNRR